MKPLQSLKHELNECHVHQLVMYTTVEMEKIQNDLNFFFQKGKKNKGKPLISIKMLLFLETIMASCTNFPATRVSSYQ